MDIRDLDPAHDRAKVQDFLTEAQDYYHLWKGRAPAQEEVEDIFTGAPPNCDPARSKRLGLYLEDQLSGIAELSFGWPEAGDAYLGLMILAPRARSSGQGAGFLDHVEDIAREHGCPTLFLAVLEKNTRGRAFWDKMGFSPTGVMRETQENGLHHRIYRLKKPL